MSFSSITALGAPCSIIIWPNSHVFTWAMDASFWDRVIAAGVSTEDGSMWADKAHDFPHDSPRWPKAGKGATIKPIRVHIAAWETVIFRSDLFHAGDEYGEDNTRFHCFWDTAGVKRAAGDTTMVEEWPTSVLRPHVLQPFSNVLCTTNLKKASLKRKAA
jgi:hypothetical protein